MNVLMILLLCCIAFALDPPAHAPPFADSYYATSDDACYKEQLPNCPSDFVGGQILSQIYYDYPNQRAMAIDNYNVARTNLSSDQTYVFENNSKIVTQVFKYYAGASGWTCLQTAFKGSFIPPTGQTKAVYNGTTLFNRYLSYRYIQSNPIPSLEQYWYTNTQDTNQILGFASVDGAEVGVFLSYNPDEDISSPNIWEVPPGVCPDPVPFHKLDILSAASISRLFCKIPVFIEQF